MLRLSLFLIFFSISVLNCNEYLDECSDIYFNFYKEIVSPVKSSVSHCQFEPSCSGFAKESIKEYGFPVGILLTADRLIRCSGGTADKNHYPYKNRKFIDYAQMNFIFGKGGMHNASFSYIPENKQIYIDSTFLFPFSLYKKQKYSLSSLEIERILFLSDNDSNIITKSNLLLSLNEFLNSHNINSLNYLENIEQIEDIDLKRKYFHLKYLILDYHNLNTYNINICDTFSVYFDKEELAKLKIYSCYRNQEDVNYIDSIITKENFDSKEEIRTFILNTINKKVKSPFVAGMLSAIIPGTGYFYTGQYKEGISAFLINSLLGIGIYSLFTNDNTGSGILTSLVAFPFYLGNIVGAANSAEVENELLLKNNTLLLRKNLNIDFYFNLDNLDYLWE